MSYVMKESKFYRGKLLQKGDAVPKEWEGKPFTKKAVSERKQKKAGLSDRQVRGGDDE